MRMGSSGHLTRGPIRYSPLLIATVEETGKKVKILWENNREWDGKVAAAA